MQSFRLKSKSDFPFKKKYKCNKNKLWTIYVARDDNFRGCLCFSISYLLVLSGSQHLMVWVHCWCEELRFVIRIMMMFDELPTLRRTRYFNILIRLRPCARGENVMIHLYSSFPFSFPHDNIIYFQIWNIFISNGVLSYYKMLFIILYLKWKIENNEIVCLGVIFFCMDLIFFSKYSIIHFYLYGDLVLKYLELQLSNRINDVVDWPSNKECWRKECSSFSIVTIPL